LNNLERLAKEGDSPVGENDFILLDISLEYHWERKPNGKLAGLSAKAKYSTSPIVN